MTDTWNTLSTLGEWEHIKEKSFNYPVIVFKHSTRCSISAVAWRRFNDKMNKLDNLASDSFNYLDIISNREISNTIATQLNVRHESPQLLLILNGECVHDSSHMSISVDSLKNIIEGLQPNSK
jgi:bacillithiol system protein YtxJ